MVFVLLEPLRITWFIQWEDKPEATASPIYALAGAVGGFVAGILITIFTGLLYWRKKAGWYKLEYCDCDCKEKNEWLSRLMA